MMRRSAGFDADKARRQLLKEWYDVPALELTANDYITCRVNSVDLKNRCRDIETDCRDRLHVWLLRIVGASTAPTSMALPCRWRSRPQHQNRTHALQQRRCMGCNDLFDHLVGALLQKPRHLQPERLSGLEIDRQYEFGRQLNGKLAAFSPRRMRSTCPLCPATAVRYRHHRRSQAETPWLRRSAPPYLRPTYTGRYIARRNDKVDQRCQTTTGRGGAGHERRSTPSPQAASGTAIRYQPSLFSSQTSSPPREPDRLS